MIRSSACPLRQADPFPAPSGKHGDRRRYTTPWDIIVAAANLTAARKFMGSLSQRVKTLSGYRNTVRPWVGANVCINALLEHKSLVCMINPEVGRPKGSMDAPLAGNPQAIVVGAGPAGLEAARRLALRGVRTRLIPTLIDQNPLAHCLRPMDLIFQGRSCSFRHA